jgi:2,3-diketo-5-methylthio-1-phosphopentane phosphatase
VFVDFDGTVSKDDVVDAILEAHADPGWHRIEDEWQAGRMGSRECLREQMSLVRATEQEMNALVDRIELDEGFGALLHTCARHAVPIHIVSDGFDYCIERILRRAERDFQWLPGGLQVCASHLEPGDDRTWRVGFPFFPDVCAHGCATCKPAAMHELCADGHGPNVFVGDGLSDRYAAAAADMVFAKSALARHCRSERIAFTPFETLRQVSVALEQLLHDPAIRTAPGRIIRGRAWAQ